MLVDLLEHLRCPNQHADSWLVATALRTADRHILEGTLGCPVCGAEFAIRDGVASFGPEDPPPSAEAQADIGGETFRLAALLAASDRGGLYVLGGAWGELAHALSDLLDESRRARLMLVSPPRGVVGWSTLRGAGDTLPLATGSASGVAIDRASVPFVQSAVLVLGSKGRLVAPAATPLPAGIMLLARDDRHWVGERESGAVDSPLVMPRRAAPHTESR